MAVLLSSNSLSRVSSQYHGPGFNKSLNGFITFDAEKLYATWLIKPNHDLASVIHRGLGKDDMALSSDSDGFIPEDVMRNPAKSMSDMLNLNFLGLNTTPLLEQ